MDTVDENSDDGCQGVHSMHSRAAGQSGRSNTNTEEVVSLNPIARLRVVFFVLLTLGAAAPVVAWELSDSQQPGSVIVFPKFITGTVETPDQGTLPVTQFKISVTCPKGSACAELQDVTLRAHWVCPGDEGNVCQEVDFPLSGTVNGTIVFSPDSDFVPQPPCERGYLIAWVVDQSKNPVKFDALIGDAVIRGSPTSARAYNALPIQAARWLTTGDPTDRNGDGRLAFNGDEYMAITGKIFGSVQFETTPEIETSLTLLTLDVFSNRQNDLTNVDLNFYNAFESLTSTSTTFTCWRQVRLTDINPSLNTFDQSSAKGLVESTAAVQSTGPVTLVGFVETQEAFTLSVAGAGTGKVVIPYPVDVDNLPPGCRYIQGPPSRIKCNVDVNTLTQVPGIREYASSLYNDGTPVATTFCPKSANNCTDVPGAEQCPPGMIFDPATGTCVAQCPDGQIFDPGSAMCVCPSGQQMCPNGTCIPESNSCVD
jgi:hypothetical protein